MRNYIAAMGGPSGRTFIVNEDCEGTGTPTGWTNASGAPQINWDYSAVPLAGSQSLYLTIAGAIGLTRNDFTDMTEGWIYFLIKLTNGSAPAGTRAIGGIGPNGGAAVTNINITATLRPQLGNTSPANSLVIDTIYHMWLHYKQGTGADAVTDCGFSTDGVRPTSGGNYAQATNGSATNLFGRLTIGSGGTTTNVDVVYDNIRVSSTQIGDNGT